MPHLTVDIFIKIYLIIDQQKNNLKRKGNGKGKRNYPS